MPAECRGIWDVSQKAKRAEQLGSRDLSSGSVPGPEGYKRSLHQCPSEPLASCSHSHSQHLCKRHGAATLFLLWPLRKGESWMSYPSVHPGACPICLSPHPAPQAVQTPLFHLPLSSVGDGTGWGGVSTEGAVEGYMAQGRAWRPWVTREDLEWMASWGSFSSRPGQRGGKREISATGNSKLGGQRLLLRQIKQACLSVPWVLSFIWEVDVMGPPEAAHPLSSFGKEKRVSWV